MISNVNNASLVDLLRRRADTQPEDLIYSFQQEDGEVVSYTYSELDVRARALAAQLQKHHRLGERALLLYQPSLDYIVAFFGCLYAGVLPVPAYPPRQNGNLTRLHAVVKDARASIALTTQSIWANIQRRFGDLQELAGLHWLVTDDLALEDAAGWQQPLLSADSLAFLQYTSGSTSTPKGVMLSHGNLQHNLEMIQKHFRTTPDSRGVIWLPPYHDMGLIGGILNPLFTGYPVMLMAPVDFITRPLRWLEAISSFGATVSGGPNFAYDLCLQKITPEQRDRLDLSTWVNAFSGAEPIRKETLDRFADYFAPCGFRQEAFYPCYGLAEGTLFVSGGMLGTPPVTRSFQAKFLENHRLLPAKGNELARTLVSSGRIDLINQEILIVDTETFARCSEEQVGEIWIKGPSIAKGYWGRETQTKETFDAYLSDTLEGPYLRTGDLGFVQNCELFVTGRLKDLIIIRGRNYYPQDIEFTVQGCHPGVGSGNGAAFAIECDGEEQLVIVHEIERQYRKANHAEIVQNIRQAVSMQHQLSVYAVVLLKPASIPKTSSGKIQRHACRERFLKDSLEVVYHSFRDADQQADSTIVEAEAVGDSNWEWTRASLLKLSPEERQRAIEQYLMAKSAEVLKTVPNEFNPQQSIRAWGLDSLMAVELKNAMEERLQIELPPSLFLEEGTFAEIGRELLGVIERAPVGQEMAPTVTPRDIKQVIPLSYGQRAIWFLQQMEPQNTAYNITRAIRFNSELNTEALQQAFATLADRHPMLRTTFGVKANEPMQCVQTEAQIEFVIHDASFWQEELLQNTMSQTANESFDLERGPLIRVHLYRLMAKEFVLLLSMHHIIIDFWSIGLMMKELWKLYETFRNGEQPLPGEVRVSYGDFVNWQSQWLESPKGERSYIYWQQELDNAPLALNLPTDRPRPHVQTYHGASFSFQLPESLSAKVRVFANERGTTLYVVLLAAYQVLLHQYSGQDDLLVGSPMANRTSNAWAELVGNLMNPVVLRGRLAGAPTFDQFLEQMRKTVLEALNHQEYPFPLLVERLQPQRDLSYSPFFQVMFTMQKSNLPGLEGLTASALNRQGAPLVLSDLQGETLTLEQQASQMDLWLTMGDVNGELAGTFEYNSDLFDRATIERMAGHFEMILKSVIRNPEQKVTQVPLLTESEYERMLIEWNQTDAQVEQGVCIHQLFEKQAEKTPEAVAVVFRDQHLTYGELNRRANQLAHLLQRQGVGADTLVGICMERSLEMMVGLLGVLKAGGAYVPLDPTYPPERLAYILDDAGATVLLQQKRLFKRLPQHQAQTVFLESDWGILDGESAENPASDVRPEHLAYMIYTSGSTGNPKGVMIEHRNVVNFFAGMDQRIGCSEQDTLLAVTSISFDISVLELFWTLARGAKVVLLSEQEASGGLARSERKQVDKKIDFSLFFFASDKGETGADKYHLLTESARFADQNGFSAVWTPERHFHQFGGLYPSPSVIGGALAMITERVKLRSGSVVLPLHHPVRVVEDWSVVDNLSRGRVELSFASGWHANDFVFQPENYADRSNRMFEMIKTIQKLWQGDSVSFQGGVGEEVQVRTLPRPVQSRLPVWITSGGNIETFRRAGQIGANLLTHLLGQSVEELAEKIAAYRAALAQNGFDPAAGQVALMLHTFVEDNLDEVREKVRAPFTQYLRSSFGLVENLVRSVKLDVDLQNLSDQDREDLLDFAFDRYFETSGLFGTPETCLTMIDRLQAIGVDEVACLIDFGVDTSSVLGSLDKLNELRKQCVANVSLDEEAEIFFAVQAKQQGATMLQCTPSLLRVLGANSDNETALQNLRMLLLGGEALPEPLATEWSAKLPQTRIVNMYGPTEATVWTTTQEIGDADDLVTIGRPFANMRTYVLDANLNPVPVGVPGELYIGGRGVARGYYNRPDLTEERFVQNPFCETKDRLYKTGDLVQYLSDGRIQFLGRIDHQVKLRGFRIELGEIETALARHENVKEAVVVVREEAIGDRYLTAYLTTIGKPPTQATLRESLGTSLPEYMVPSFYVFLEHMPLTPNGKVDRKALPDPSTRRVQLQTEYVAPQSELEQKLSVIWKDVLHMGQVGIHDNFFEIGGHSLQIVQVHSRLRSDLQVNIPLVQLFQYPTVHMLAKFLSQGQGEQSVAQKSQVRAENRRDLMQQRRQNRSRRR